MPLMLTEEYMKHSFASIIGESFVQSKLICELGDLFTTIFLHYGIRINSTFIFKGKGIRTKLTIANCGKNDDPILRLVKLPAQLFLYNMLTKSIMLFKNY